MSNVVEHGLLYTSEDKIIGSPNVLHHEQGVIILSVYQGRYLLDWFYSNNLPQKLKYKDKLYELIYFLPDVIECDLPKFKKLFDDVIKKSIYFSVKQLRKAVRQDVCSGDGFGDGFKMILLVLCGDKQWES